MAKTKNVEKRYFKLGKAAASFTDAASGLNIRGKEIVSIDNTMGLGSKGVSEGLTSGHIIELKAGDIKDEQITSLPIIVPEPKSKKVKVNKEVVANDDDDDDEDEDKKDEEEDDEEDDDDDLEDDLDDEEDAIADKKAPVKKVTAPAKGK